MSDYISREDVKKLLWERISLATFMRRGIPNAMKSLSLISEELEKIPAADVRPVIPAQWIALDIYRSEGNYKCSNCGQPCYVPECMGEPAYSVCPNCGAKMGGTP